MKHTFGYPSLVTEGRLLVSCALAWFLSVLQTVLLLFNETVFWGTKVASDTLSLVAIFFCHVTVFRETRRHEQRVAAQQATLRARNEFERNKKAVKLTAIIVAVLMLCLVPSKIAVMLLRFTSDTAKEAFFTVFLSSQVLSFLNSLLNPIIYVVRMRQFRVAFIELLFRTVHTVDAEETEMRLFGVSNAVVRVNRVKADQDQNEKPQHDVNEENV